MGVGLAALRALRGAVPAVPQEHLGGAELDGRDEGVLRHPAPVRGGLHPGRGVHPGAVRHGAVQHRRAALPHPGGHLPDQPPHHARVQGRVQTRKKPPGPEPARAAPFVPPRASHGDDEQRG